MKKHSTIPIVPKKLKLAIMACLAVVAVFPCSAQLTYELRTAQIQGFTGNDQSQIGNNSSMINSFTPTASGETLDATWNQSSSDTGQPRILFENSSYVGAPLDLTGYSTLEVIMSATGQSVIPYLDNPKVLQSRPVKRARSRCVRHISCGPFGPREIHIILRAAKIFCDVPSQNLLISEAGMSLWRTADEHFSGPRLSSV